MISETIKWATLSKVGLISGLVIGGYIIYKKLMQKAENKVKNEFRLTILRSAAYWLASKLDASEKQIELALEHWLDKGEQDSVIASVLRIECEVTRGETECPIKVAIALVKEGKVIIGEVEQKISCGDLPEGIREEFIRSVDKDTQNIIVSERQQQ
jgi:hypothetical protein